ncbi:MAG: NEAT domain-containing protein [Eubacterium sp.]|nr:NEAT domain-containing protein [Eubacterium sp.]
MKKSIRKKIKRIQALLSIACLMAGMVLGINLVTVGLCAQTDSTSTYYSIEGVMYRAGADDTSMGNEAIEQMYLEKKADGTMQLRLTLKPIETMGMNGYLGWVRYYDEYDSEIKPTNQTAVKAQVLSTYTDVYDSYNNASSGTDDEMKGNLYPRVVTIPVEQSQSTYWIQIYVPLMESISSGSGTQLARLGIDYDSMKQVEKKIVEQKEAYTTQTTSSTDQETKESVDTNQTSDEEDDSDTKTNSNSNSKLNIKKLEDGTYYLASTMLKTDKKTTSMASAALDSVVTLKVKNGNYKVLISFSGMSVGTSKGYLGNVRYYTNTFKASSDKISGKTKAAKVVSYQTDKDGNKMKDNYGSNYPKQVSLPLIKKAINNKGYVPLQVYVPVMEAISPGSGSQNVYLKLDYTSLTKKKSKVDAEQSNANATDTEDSKEETNTTSSGQGTSLSEASSLAKLEEEETESESEISSVAKFCETEDTENAKYESATGHTQDEEEVKEPPLRKYALPGGVIILVMVGLGIANFVKRRKYDW